MLQVAADRSQIDSHHPATTPDCEAVNTEVSITFNSLSQNSGIFKVPSQLYLLLSVLCDLLAILALAVRSHPQPG